MSTVTRILITCLIVWALIVLAAVAMLHGLGPQEDSPTPTTTTTTDAPTVASPFPPDACPPGCVIIVRR